MRFEEDTYCNDGNWDLHQLDDAPQPMDEFEVSKLHQDALDQYVPDEFERGLGGKVAKMQAAKADQRAGGDEARGISACARANDHGVGNDTGGTSSHGRRALGADDADRTTGAGVLGGLLDLDCESEYEREKRRAFETELHAAQEAIRQRVHHKQLLQQQRQRVVHPPHMSVRGMVTERMNRLSAVVPPVAPAAARNAVSIRAVVNQCGDLSTDVRGYQTPTPIQQFAPLTSHHLAPHVVGSPIGEAGAVGLPAPQMASSQGLPAAPAQEDMSKVDIKARMTEMAERRRRERQAEADAEAERQRASASAKLAELDRRRQERETIAAAAAAAAKQREADSHAATRANNLAEAERSIPLSHVVERSWRSERVELATSERYSERSSSSHLLDRSWRAERADCAAAGERHAVRGGKGSGSRRWRDDTGVLEGLPPAFPPSAMRSDRRMAPQGRRVEQPLLPSTLSPASLVVHATGLANCPSGEPTAGDSTVMHAGGLAALAPCSAATISRVPGTSHPHRATQWDPIHDPEADSGRVGRKSLRPQGQPTASEVSVRNRSTIADNRNGAAKWATAALEAATAAAELAGRMPGAGPQAVLAAAAKAAGVRSVVGHDLTRAELIVLTLANLIPKRSQHEDRAAQSPSQFQLDRPPSVVPEGRPPHQSQPTSPPPVQHEHKGRSQASLPELAPQPQSVQPLDSLLHLQSAAQPLQRRQPSMRCNLGATELDTTPVTGGGATVMQEIDGVAERAPLDEAHGVAELPTMAVLLNIIPLSCRRLQLTVQFSTVCPDDLCNHGKIDAEFADMYVSSITTNKASARARQAKPRHRRGCGVGKAEAVEGVLGSCAGKESTLARGAAMLHVSGAPRGERSAVAGSVNGGTDEKIRCRSMGLTVGDANGTGGSKARRSGKGRCRTRAGADPVGTEGQHSSSA